MSSDTQNSAVSELMNVESLLGERGPRMRGTQHRRGLALTSHSSVTGDEGRGRCALGGAEVQMQARRMGCRQSE